MTLKDDIETAKAVYRPIRRAFQFYDGASMIYECYEPQIDEARDDLETARSRYQRARDLYRSFRS